MTEDTSWHWHLQLPMAEHTGEQTWSSGQFPGLLDAAQGLDQELLISPAQSLPGRSGGGIMINLLGLRLLLQFGKSHETVISPLPSGS